MLNYSYEKKQQHCFTLDPIGNKNETFVTFDLPTNKMVNKKGKKAVLI